MTPDHPSADQASVQDQAIAWLVRVQSDAATGDDWLELEAWLAAAPEHLTAFAAVEATAADAADAAPELLAGLADDSDDGRVADLTARRAARLGLSRRGWMTAAASAAAAAVVGTVGVSLLRRSPGILYETRRGESRSVRLQDGTTIGLNGASRLRVRFDHGERRVFMEDAEASFDVAHDASRPFLIDAGDRQVRVVGTEFNVRNAASGLTVTVRRGIVEVSDPRGRDPTARLTRGLELVHLAGAAGSTVRSVVADDAFAWRSGRLVCRDRRLADIVADLNRRLPVPITVEGHAGDLRFSGVIVTDDEDAALGALEAYLPVRAARTSGAIRLVSR